MAQRGAQGRPGAPRAAQGRPRGTPARGKQLYIQTHVRFSATGRFEHRFEELINRIYVIFPRGSFSDFKILSKSSFRALLSIEMTSRYVRQHRSTPTEPSGPLPELRNPLRTPKTTFFLYSGNSPENRFFPFFLTPDQPLWRPILCYSW